jgi:flagellum-specific peptidoglycan hydrolase FlgJ
MFYRLDKKGLEYVRIKMFWFIILLLSVILFIVIILSFFNTIEEKIIEQKVIVVMNQQNKFEESKFIKKIKELNFQFPHIVYAQSILETDSFRSNIFKENNNLFGMKQAVIRVNLAKGVQYNHAYYDNWTDSLLDYALYYSTYLSQLKTEDDYFNYLSQFYAEDKEYVNKLKTLINKLSLREIFNK